MYSYKAIINEQTVHYQSVVYGLDHRDLETADGFSKPLSDVHRNAEADIEQSSDLDGDTEMDIDTQCDIVIDPSSCKPCG